MNEAYDFAGNILAIGDNVAFINARTQELNQGTIIKLNKTQATIRDPRWQDGPHKDSMGYGKTVRRYACIVKISRPL